MPDPARFPPEITALIFDDATDDNRDARSLARFCRVNRQWLALARPRLYVRWIYNGREHSFGLLWSFLCSMIRNHEIASLVRFVHVSIWEDPRRDLALGDQVDVAPEDVALVQQAFQAAGIEEMDSYTMINLRQGDRRPFMALLFTRLPNLFRLSALLFSHDPFIAGVTHQALIDHHGRSTVQAFQNLKELRIVIRRYPTYETGLGIPDHLYKLGFYFPAPISSLAQLENLSINNLDDRTSDNYSLRPRTSSIKKLTLVNHNWSTAKTLETLAVIAMPKALTSLSFYQNDHDAVQLRSNDRLPVSNAQIFSILRQYRKSLEHLDICRSFTISTPGYYNTISHFGSLREFERLKKICIQPKFLLGGCSGEPEAPFRLKDTLPASLESLIFYRDDGSFFDLRLAEQLREILLSNDFTHLKSIVFEDVSVNTVSPPPDVSSVFQAVKEICKEAGVTLKSRQVTADIRESLIYLGGILRVRM